jgi:hypothetical protein
MSETCKNVFGIFFELLIYLSYEKENKTGEQR